MYAGDDRPAQLRTLGDEELARRLTRKLKDDRRTRARRMARIKRAVESSDYENALKLSVALDRLLERLT
jgi:hypothetical protein